jgi:serine protease AprX
VVSGEAALLLQAMPNLTPDQVKQILMGSASGLNNVSARMEGSGTTDLRKALRSVPRTVVDPAPWGTGTGSLEASRGSFHIVVGDGTAEETTLLGEVDVFGRAWNAVQWARDTQKGKTWRDGAWMGNTLTARGWTNTGEAHKSWPTATWTSAGAVLADGEWAGRMWRDGEWAGRMWRDSAWSGRMWRSGGFSSAGWF